MNNLEKVGGESLSVFDPYYTTGMELLETAKTIVVSDQEEKESAELFLSQVNDVEKSIKKAVEETKEPWYRMYKAILEKGKVILKPTEQAKALVKKSLVEYAKEVARIQREKELELQRKKEEAEAKAEAERKKKEEEEKARLAELEKEDPEKAKEERRKIEAEQTLEELNGEAKSEELAKLEEEQKKLEKEAKENKVKGTRQVKKFEVVDPMQVPRAYLVPDEKLIRQAVSNGANEIPGVKIRVETVVQ